MASPLEGIKVTLIDTWEEAAFFGDWLSRQNSISIDTETTGLDTYKDKVRLIQFGNAEEGWVLPVEGPASWAGLAIDALRRYLGHINMHHGKFDVNMIDTTLGVKLDVSKIDDTMLMGRAMEPHQSASLKMMCARFIDPDALHAMSRLDEAMREGKHTWASVPVTFGPYWYYAGFDTVLTEQLADNIRERVSREAEKPYQLELGAAHICGSMERHGALVDSNRTARAMKELEQYIEQSADWCMENYGVKPGSNGDVITALAREGFDFTKRTPGGDYSLDKEVLSGIKHPLAETVLSRRQAQKVYSTYLRNFSTQADSGGRIHPRINSCAAVTGRMSMDNPNLQNLPRRGTTPFGEVVRSCIVAEEGHTLLMADFSQVEWRLFASVSGDQGLIDAFKADDFFTEMCRQVFNDPSITSKDPRRQVTKNAMYARIYGAGDEKFSVTAGISVNEAKKFNALLDHRYPAIRQLQRSVEAKARTRLTESGQAFIKSPLTGRRYVIEDDAYYKLVNYLFQGTAAEILKLKLIELAAAGLEEFMVIPVHDEIILEVPNEDLEDVAHQVQTIMSDSTLFKVPLESTLASGTNWGAKKDLVLS